jgi:hypothetical protein
MNDPAQREAAQLSVDLEVKLLERLGYEWRAINYTYFKDALRQPVLRLSDTRTRLGQWHGELRSLEISLPLVLERPWPHVIEVLKHEVAHQFIDERLSVDETAHGPTFRRICERLGIDARAVGDPGAADGLEPQDDPADAASRMVARIRKLLALAQSPNQNEAENAATAARRLMLKFNIEVDAGEGMDPARRHYGYRHLGTPTGRVLEHDRRLATILIQYFFVEGLWIPVYRPLEGKRGSVLEICGLEANLLMAEHVHAFLTATALRLWTQYKRETTRSSNRDRQAFLAGVMRGFEAKLATQSQQFSEQGLVWVPAPDLHDYFRRRYPRQQTVRRSCASRNDAYAEGSRAGREIVLSQPVASSSSKGPTKALGRGR